MASKDFSYGSTHKGKWGSCAQSAPSRGVWRHAPLTRAAAKGVSTETKETPLNAPLYSKSRL